MQSPVRRPQQIALDDPKSFDIADHHLRTRDQSSCQSERHPFPRMDTPTHKILPPPLVAPRRQNQPQPVRNILDRAVKVIRAAHHPQDQQQHRKKSEKHVEGNRLAQRDAVRKNPPQSAECVLYYASHVSPGGLYENPPIPRPFLFPARASPGGASQPVRNRASGTRPFRSRLLDSQKDCPHGRSRITMPPR